jgi:flagellar hook protein FlgE
MFTSFQTALSALDATSTAIDVTGNNLANLNTTGYKESGVSFHDLVAQSFGAVGQSQPGFGVARAQIVQNFVQGALQPTSGALDAAIQGDGFFVLKAANGQQLLTRAGNFTIDTSGNLLSATGEAVQGWTQLNSDGTVNTSGPVAKIQVPTGTLRQPTATTNFSFNMNLNAAAVVGQATGTFSTPIQIVDSLGETQTLTATFTETASNAWSYAVTIPPSALTSASTTALATGNLTFDSSGHLTAPTSAQIPVTATGLADGAADLTMNWNLKDATSTALLTQVNQPSATSNLTQNGIQASQLVRVAIGAGGALLAQYSDGSSTTVGQIALASVRNPSSLTPVGNNNFASSADTAPPVVGITKTGGRGDILGSTLESSTVDIAKEFTNLIVYQRSYQANAKVINTEDQLSQETISIKQ